MCIMCIVCLGYLPTSVCCDTPYLSQAPRRFQNSPLLLSNNHFSQVALPTPSMLQPSVPIVYVYTAVLMLAVVDQALQ